MTTPEPLALFATIILLFPMGYLLACPAFLLVRLSHSAIPRLLRAMFSGYFLMLMVTGGFATFAYAATDHIVFAVAMCLLAGAAFMARRWFLQRIDAEIIARDAGDANAVRRMRLMHVGGMAVNALILAVFINRITTIF